MFGRKLRTLVGRLRKAYSVLTGTAFCFSKSEYEYYSFSFSQEGEDGILQRLFESKSLGFYVDVGSHHPQRFSNTYRFYLRGWHGINIDPLPGSKKGFDILRNRDINLEAGVSDSTDELVYHAFQEPALNTFDPGIAESRVSQLISKAKVKVRTLTDILDQYLPANQNIDFLTIDVEGLDLQVLRSNDWTRYRPTYVLAEALGMRDICQVIESDLHKYMNSLGYSFFAKCVNTLIFVDSRG
jgi:FkbM family methyltransferase